MALDGKATLTSVQSQEENDYLQSLFEDFVWTGGSDAAEEGVWRWVNYSVYDLVESQFLGLKLYTNLVDGSQDGMTDASVFLTKI